MWLFCGVSYARRDEPTTLIRSGLQCYEQLNYRCAIKRLTLALPKLLKSEPRSFDVYKTLGFSHGALGQLKQATRFFEKALALKPSFQLDAKVISPRIYKAFRLALEKALRGTIVYRPAPLLRITPVGPPIVGSPELILRKGFQRVERGRSGPYQLPVELSLDGGYLFLFGNDSDNYKHGPVVGLRLGYRLITTVLLRVSLMQSFHEVTEAFKQQLEITGSETLFLLRLHLGIGWQVWQSRRMVLELEPGLGLGFFGLGSLSGNTSFSAGLRVNYDVLVTDNIRIGVRVHPAMMAASNSSGSGSNWLVSFMISVSGVASFSF